MFDFLSVMINNNCMFSPTIRLTGLLPYKCTSTNTTLTVTGYYFQGVDNSDLYEVIFKRYNLCFIQALTK